MPTTGEECPETDPKAARRATKAGPSVNFRGDVDSEPWKREISMPCPRLLVPAVALVNRSG